MDCENIEQCLSSKEKVNSFNICRINCYARVLDPLLPPNNTQSASGTGTGFLLNCFPETNDKIYIITAYHVVQNHVNIRVNFSQIDPLYINVSFIGANAVMDVAILCMENAEFVSKLRDIRTKEGDSLICGNSDILVPPSKVTALGFALGKTHLQTTQGVLSSRIDSPSRLQVDVAVNPGNSGGPLCNSKNEVIGIVTSGLQDARGINYVAPINETIIILKRILENNIVFDHIPSFNAGFSKANLTLLKNSNGVYCNSVHPFLEYPQTTEEVLRNLKNINPNHEFISIITSKKIDDTIYKDETTWMELLGKTNLNDIKNTSLREGDILYKIELNNTIYDIDIQMTSNFEFWTQNNIGFSSILDRSFCGQEIKYHILRKNRNMIINTVIHKPYNIYRTISDEHIDYCVLGGVFVSPLRPEHISSLKREDLRTFMRRPKNKHFSFLIITHILPESPFTACETVFAGDILVAINNTQTRTLQDCINAWNKEMVNDIITLRMYDETFASANTNQIKECELKIKETYNEKYIGYHLKNYQDR